MFGSKTYKYKHDKVEAIQFLGYNWADCQDFVAGEALMHPSWLQDYDTIEVETISGKSTVWRYDYIVRAGNAVLVCAPKAFEKTFEAVEE